MFDSGGAGTPKAAEALWDALSGAASGSLELLAALDPRALEESCARRAVVRLEQLRRSLDAAQAHLLAELHAEGSIERSDGLATSRWLAREAMLPAGAARQRVRVAGRLASDLGEVDRALAAGRIGHDHARAFADAVNDRNAAAMAPEVPRLIERASRTTFERWRRELDALASLLDPDGPPPDDVDRNRLTFSPTDGYSLLRGELHGEHDVVTRQAVDAVADELFRQFSRDREQFPDQRIPPRATLRALALAEICRRANAVDPATGAAPRPDATIVVHDDPTRPVQPTLPAHTAAMLLCTAVSRVLSVAPDGSPLTGSVAVHDPTRAQRRALAVRDGGCTFPGCGAPVTWCDAHHAVPHPVGPTSLDNLCLLCRHHHRVAHRQGWTMILVDGWTRWASPEGVTRWGQRHQRQRAGPRAPAAA